MFHALPREYPAAATALFLAPLALPLPYALGFALVAAGGVVVLVLSSDGLAAYPGLRQRRTCLYLLVGAAAVVFARYDVFPALAALLAVEAARREQWGRAWAWAVVGGFLKLFPFLLLPGFLIAERVHTGKWPLRRLWIVSLPAALLTLGQLATAPTSLLNSFTYQLHRGFELSSVQGSIAFLLGPLHARWVTGFWVYQLAGRDHHLAISLLVMVAAGAALLAIWAFARRGQLSVVAVSLGVLLGSGIGGEELCSPIPCLAGATVGLLANATRVVSRRPVDDRGLSGPVCGGSRLRTRLFLGHSSGDAPQCGTCGRYAFLVAGASAGGAPSAAGGL